MKTRSFSDLFTLVESLCGVQFATNEKPRIKALINRRARHAYRLSNYWTRFLVVGEERAVDENNSVPFSEAGKRDIDTFTRIYRIAPFGTISAQEFDYIVTSTGAFLVSGQLEQESVFVTYKASLDDIYGDGAGETSVVPLEWFEYLAYGAYADFLRSEGQQEKAALADQEAEILLQDELIRLDENHTSGLVSQRILTNLSMQLR